MSTQQYCPDYWRTVCEEQHRDLSSRIGIHAPLGDHSTADRRRDAAVRAPTISETAASSTSARISRTSIWAVSSVLVAVAVVSTVSYSPLAVAVVVVESILAKSPLILSVAVYSHTRRRVF